MRRCRPGRARTGPDPVRYQARRRHRPRARRHLRRYERLGDYNLERESAHLGWTLCDSRFWSTYVNPEAKPLLLTHAFEDLGYGRVKIQTDKLNTRSQAAIAKLGATREGVLRRHVPREDGTFRDTVVFSITIDDWPSVKQGLQARIQSI